MAKLVRATVVYGNEADGIDGHENMDPWTVTLRYDGRRMTVPFWTGLGLRDRGEPTAADVLECVISDALAYDDAVSFEDFCRAFGYDTDSRRAEATYKACERMYRKLRQLLGEDWGDLIDDYGTGSLRDRCAA